MLTVLVLTACGFSGLGCTDEELTAPRRAVQEVTANTLVVSDSLCAKMQFTITSPTAVTTAFPNRTTCSTTGLVLIRGQAATWAQSPNRRLTLFVRLLNKSGSTLQLPVRLYLPPTGTTVVAPSGTPASKVVPLGPDSVEAGGGKIWFIGGTGTLAANDSTVQDTIKVNVMSPVTQARFQFQASATTYSATAPAIPTTITWPLANPLTVTSTTNPNFKYYRNVVGVSFGPTPSGPAVSAFLQKYGATIIGGLDAQTPTAEYVMQVPDPGPLFSALTSLVQAMSAEPGVTRVQKFTFGDTPRVRSRYPVDPIFAAQRSSWFSSTNIAVRPYVAVRAPLAWGCETGTYGQTTRPRVGVWDSYFDAVPVDLPTPLAALKPPSTNLILADTSLSNHPTHAIGVAGILTAKGDNGVDMSGMIWNSDLELYAFATGGSQVMNPVTYFKNVVDSAAAHGVQVLNISGTLGDITDTGTVFMVRASVQRYLDSGSDRLVVQAAGDDSLTITLAALATSVDTTLRALDRALAQLSQLPAYQNRIQFVTGTVASTGSKAGRSNIWTGAAMIAAPADTVVSLGATSGGGFAYHGTSFAAPFVTGTAALLWAMEPSLTAAEVVDFIRRGAQVPRINPTTGVSAPPPNIGVSGIYQLDAYGALSLLSKERSETPICGYPVWYGPTGEVALLRNGLTSPEEIGPSGLLAFNASVAQGGRLILADALLPTSTGFADLYRGVLQNGQWQWTLIPGHPDLEAWSFLELDTVMLKATALTSTALTLTGPGRPGPRGPVLTNVDLFLLPSVLGPGGQYAGGTVVLPSPDGQWAMIALVKLVGSTLVRGTYLVKLADLSAVTITEAPDGTPTDIIIRAWAWSHDGTKFLGNYEPNGVPDHSSVYRMVDVTATTAVVRFPDVVATGKLVAPVSQAFSIEDAVVFSEELDLATPSICTPVQRRTSDLAVTQNLGQFGNSTCMGPAIPQANLMAGRASARRDTVVSTYPRPRRLTPIVMPQPGRFRAN